MAKKNLGRPTKRTPTTVRKLEEAFALGCSVTEAALFADISRQSLYDWMESDTEFSDRIELLRSKPILQARKVIHDAIKKGDARWAAWFLEHRVRSEFGPDSQDNLLSKVPITLVKFVGDDGEPGKRT